MRLTEEQIAKIRTASRLGKDIDVEKAVFDAISETNKTREWQKEVEEWIHTIDEEFNVSECYKELRVATTEEKRAIRVAISRFKKDGLIEKIKGRIGCYRKKDADLVEMHWQDAKPIPLDISWPLDLNTLFHIYKKNIVLFSGTDDAGKTGVAMDIIKRNQKHLDWKDNIFLFNSEMSEEEMNLRFTLHENMSIDDWDGFKTYDRDANFGDAVQPNGLNIVDYLDLPGDAHYKLGDYIREIHNALEGGVCVIMLHKKHGAELGYGVELGLKIPRLYVTLENGVAKIIKCKNRKTEKSCRGWIMKYSLIQGWKFVTHGIWRDPEDEQDSFKPKKFIWERK